LKFREKFKWQGPLASGPQRPMATCPGPRVPTRMWQHHSGSATGHHLAPTLSAHHYHLPSTCAHACRYPDPLPCRCHSLFEHFHSHKLVSLCSMSHHTTPTAEPPASPHPSIAVLVCTGRLRVRVPSSSRHTQREGPGAPLCHPLHLPWAPPINNPHWPSSGPVNPSNSFSRPPRYSSTSSPTTSTPTPVQHRRSPPIDHHHCGAAAVVSLFLSHRPNWASPHPACSGYHHPPLADDDGRYLASEPPTGKGGIPCLSLRPKGPRGLGLRGRVGQWPIGLSPLQKCPFTFSFIFNSKLNSDLVWTLELHRDLNKFDKIINSIP
jgi:hypothetical protein